MYQLQPPRRVEYQPDHIVDIEGKLWAKNDDNRYRVVEGIPILANTELRPSNGSIVSLTQDGELFDLYKRQSFTIDGMKFIQVIELLVFGIISVITLDDKGELGQYTIGDKPTYTTISQCVKYIMSESTSIIVIHDDNQWRQYYQYRYGDGYMWSSCRIDNHNLSMGDVIRVTRSCITTKRGIFINGFHNRSQYGKMVKLDEVDDYYNSYLIRNGELYYSRCRYDTGNIKWSKFIDIGYYNAIVDDKGNISIINGCPHNDGGLMLTQLELSSN